MEEERKKKKKRKTPQNCQSPRQKQRFITIINNVTEGEKKLKILIGFHSANKIDSSNEGAGEEKKKNIQKILQNKSKNKNNKCFPWVTAVTVFSLPGSHTLPHLPRRPSNTVLISGPAVGAAQNLIWSCSCVFLPPMSTAVRTGAFSSVAALSVLLYIP